MVLQLEKSSAVKKSDVFLLMGQFIYKISDILIPLSQNRLFFAEIFSACEIINQCYFKQVS